MAGALAAVVIALLASATLALPARAEGESLEVATEPSGVLTGVDGVVWIGLALLFSVTLLTIVIVAAYRSRRSR